MADYGTNEQMESGRTGTPRRSPLVRATAAIGIALVTVVLASCYPTVKSGQRCAAGAPRGSDGRYVLDCVRGSYKRVMTLAEANRRAALLAPARIAITGGNGQQATVATSLPPMSVRVTNGNGTPAVNAVVEFSGSSLSPARQLARTGGDGVATITPQLGTVAGPFTVTAQVAGTGIATGLSARATAASPHHVAMIGGVGQSTPVFTQFPSQVVGQVLDEFGNAVSGASVRFSSPNDRVWFGPDTLVSNVFGVVSTTSGTGQIAGTEQAVATVVSSGVATQFPLVVAAGAPAAVQRNSGHQQGAFPGNGFFFALTIGVLDAFGNGVPGVPVVYTAAPGENGASITAAQTTVVTGADGVAALSVTANAISGPHQVVATVAGQTQTFSLENF